MIFETALKGFMFVILIAILAGCGSSPTKIMNTAVSLGCVLVDVEVNGKIDRTKLKCSTENEDERHRTSKNK